MNAIAKKLALLFGVLAFATSCTATPNSSTQTQSLPKVTEVSNSTKVTTIKIDGSSTVYPIAEAIANQFQQNKQQYKGRVVVSFSGTSAGFKKFCSKQTDISNASRPILKAEIEACNKNGVKFIELPVAFDALTVAVNSENTWAKDITVAELKKLWEPNAQGKITRWNQVRSSWPDKPINLYGAGGQSGTFDYFTEAIVGKTRASRTDYISSEDDLALVRGVGTDPNALGYFGLAYYEDNKSRLKPLAIDSGKGAVLPSTETVEKAEYQPLARPLLIYVNAQSLQNQPELKEFVDYYLKYAPITTSSVGYVPLPSEAYELAEKHFQAGKEGTVFAGKEQINFQISDLLKTPQK
ncbi:PstS family phosphate ABC transporter substrate-binding protein [Nostoc sp. NZL]|uniref:PstS family phosphate ABC transporter substrate-binding protein n=1 Tax=Nostoc sp. NZL TaxID=2650612 RepID=UPI0018C6A3DB|nr:PstS family phosphate ABC transporter substrate-binding protein [Nostoc sp. NZL]MBG1244072.1 PstS family phosphate ABC transporter substrate-binding protein [Nostoc sp. NZL]MBG1244934.1 PstS family phosphate ABC transporter substrate-binding protein [Nostoc sp. NZL]